MLEARAILTTPSVLSWLNSEQNDCQIAGIYRRSCNLVNSMGHYLTLALPAVGPGPFTMLIELDGSFVREFGEMLDPKGAIAITEEFLEVGKLKVRYTKAPIWDPEPNWDFGDAIMKEAWLDYLQQFLVNNAPDSSLVSLVLPQYETIYQKVALDGWLSLGEGLENYDLNQILKGTRILAGLGIGLTPAGDDFLLGAIYAIWTRQTPRLAKEMSLNIYRTAAPWTTSLSAYWLKAAAGGQASKPWHDLLQEIRNGNKLGIIEAATLLTSFGHTSGFDALAGFILASKKLSKVGSPMQLT